jgi:hypothetical protein
MNTNKSQKMRAENLQTINFMESNIGADGCLALSKANWSKISSIYLSNNTLTKAEMKLETKVVIIWRIQV